MSDPQIDVAAHLWVRGDYEVIEQVHSPESVSLTVQPVDGALGSRFTFYGHPDTLAQLLCDLDKYRNRAVAQISDGLRREAEWEAVRVATGETPAIDIKENGQ